MTLIKPQDLIDELGVDGLCATADTYFEGFDLSYEQMRKPFSNVFDAPRLLRNLGTLLGGMELRRGMTVLDFGAGTCWLSRYLAQMGCATVSVDPSEIALDLGRQWFETHPPALMPKPPQFLVFDGRTIDLPDGSVDRIISFDAFHHVPNPEEVLAEFARILRPGGIAAFSEPGPFHSRTEQSQEEMRNFKVLENDIVVEDLERWAMAGGFTHVWVEVSFVDDRIPMTPTQVTRATRTWWRTPLTVVRRLVRAAIGTLRNQHFIYMAKGPLQKDSRWAEDVAYRMTVTDLPKAVRAGEPFRLTVRIENTGDAIWLNTEAADVGNVNLALHHENTETGELESIQRFMLPRSLAPGDSVDFDVALSWPEPGPLDLHMDLVSEQITWFEHQGSTPVRVRVEVGDG